MSIALQTLLITLVMALSFVAPRVSKRLEKHSKILLLIGTGGLVSLYFGDLLPDVYQLGGFSSIGIILVVWLLYSVMHLVNIKHHEHEHDHEHSHDHDHGPGHTHVHLPESSFLLMASMISHCFSSGMLLYMSHELSTKVAASVFLALIGHKGYEALSVSVLLSQRSRELKKFIFCAVAYSLSFPLGVVVTGILTRSLGPSVSAEVLKTFAIVVASVAVGSLAGCMVHDFLIPSIRHVRAKRHEAAWMLLGVGLTLIFTVGLGAS
jgi:zinc transporter ZupT